MMDDAEKKGMGIDLPALERLLGAPVIPPWATGRGDPGPARSRPPLRQGRAGPGRVGELRP